jgi:dihydroflavonol-4-reductase
MGAMKNNTQALKPVLVTGADGFLGSNIVRALLDKGHSVRALLEPARDTHTLDGLDIEFARGDLFDPPSRRAALEGAGAVIHTVASTAVWPSRNPRLAPLNIGVALELAKDAKAAGATRFVHIGTANSFAAGSKERPGTEEGPYDAARFGLDYQDTKREAQERLLALGEDGPEIVIVNPSFMFGPYDSKPGSGEMLIQVARGAVPGASPGGRCFADVRDVAAGAVAALERGRPGSCYILGGENLSYAELFAKIAAVTGTKAPRITMPAPLVLAFGWLSERGAAIGGKQPKVSLAMARIACEGQYYSSAKARSELGYTIHPIDRAIADAYAWFKGRGML